MVEAPVGAHKNDTPDESEVVDGRLLGVWAVGVKLFTLLTSKPTHHVLLS